MAFKAGYVTLVGKPNVGKSTLLNTMVGQKVSIVSNKPQTTRKRAIGIVTTSDYQIAFIDTPGIHDAHTRLGRSMVEQAKSALTDIDVVVYVADGSHHPGEMDKEIAKSLTDLQAPLILCMNKMDLLKAEDVTRNVEAYCALIGTEDYMLTTAYRGHNVPELVAMIVDKLPEADAMYGEDELTDQSSRFMSAEFVREKILVATRQEIPHSVAVRIDEWEDDETFTRIDATILVERASQRGILIGKGGQFLKNIGIKARAEIEEMIGHQVHLQLHVKVSEDWRMNLRVLQELEYSE